MCWVKLFESLEWSTKGERSQKTKTSVRVVHFKWEEKFCNPNRNAGRFGKRRCSFTFWFALDTEALTDVTIAGKSTCLLFRKKWGLTPLFIPKLIRFSATLKKCLLSLRCQKDLPTPLLICDRKGEEFRLRFNF